MIAVFLAEGFEEVEALTPVDVLRRAGLDVRTVGVTGGTVRGNHGIPVVADMTADELDCGTLEGVVLPGGLPGAHHLDESAAVDRAVMYAAAHGLWIGAICAAPLVLGRRGLLAGRRAVCYPGQEGELRGADVGREPVAVDGRIVTARSVGAAMAFALTLAEKLAGADSAAALREKMLLP